MTKKEFEDIKNFEKNIYQQYEMKGETDNAVKAFETFVQLNEIKVNGKPLILDEVRHITDIARLHEQKELCVYLDKLMGLTEGWLYHNDELWCVTTSGKLEAKIKENDGKYSIILSPFRIQYPTQKFADMFESINNPKLVIDNDDSGYLENTISRFKKGDYILLEVYIRFNQYKDGRYFYRAHICRNLTSYCKDGIFVPDHERLGVPFGFRPSNKSIRILPYKCLNTTAVKNPKVREYHEN